MQRRNDRNNFFRNSEERRGYKQESKKVDKVWDRLAQCTGKIELFAAVMDDMIVPEKIYFMTPAVHPVTLEIDDKKCDDIRKNGGLDMNDRNFIYQPVISNDSDTNT